MKHPSTALASLALALTAVDQSAAECASVSPLEGVDIEEFTRASWYVQQQQITSYQTEDDLFCVAATYDLNQEIQPVSVPLFNGPVIGVYNYANVGGVNGIPSGSANDTVLCAREADKSLPSKLSVAPCFLPNALAGPYWIVATGRNETTSQYDWAAISGGQPTVQYDDGCTTTTDQQNNSGLWIFSRTPLLTSSALSAARSALVSLGYTLSQLIDVPQNGCKYTNAVLK